MSSDSVWSFRFTSPSTFFDDEGASGEDGTCQETCQEHQDLDLSSREEAVSYKPNPFSIAKINAAARSRKVPSTNVQEIPSGKTPVRQRHDIREAFSRQARQLHGDVGLRRPRESARKLYATVPHGRPATDVSGELVESANAHLGRDGFTDAPTTTSRRLESELFLETVAETDLREEIAEAHTSSDFSAFRGESAKPGTMLIPHSDSQSPVRNKRGFKPRRALHSRPLASREGRLTLRPTVVPPATINAGRRIRFSSPIFGCLPERTATPFKPKSPQHYPAFHSPPDYQSISVLPHNGVTHWPDVNRNPVSKSINNITTYPSVSYPLAQLGDDIDLPSDDTLVASPTLSPVISCSNRTVEAGPPEPAMYRFPVVRRDSDEGWTTLPQRKKGKTSVTKGVRSTGSFRLPGVTWNSRKLGMSPTSDRRVFTFLPPPLQNAPTATASHISLGAAEFPASPTTINYDRDMQLSVDMNAITRRYPNTKNLKQD
ncbi:hypothetical protein APHAL10511_003279 [Amanita phalloides]|nr:hypothetical protein APHAL10511_003279 [Amanita phalloides]